MTYRSVAQRLNRRDENEIEAIVKSRPELFRSGILNSRLNAWKDLMRSGKSRPNWVVEIRDQAEQRKAIDAIGRDDIFRNQFRVEDGAPKCDIAIIDWGLQHIERLRKAAAEEREVKSRKWTSIIIPLASIIVAGISVVSTIWLQRASSREQVALKHYEVSFVPKQRAYSDFMIDLEQIVSAAEARNKENFLVQTERMNSAFYSLEPFLGESNRTGTRAEYSNFLKLCADAVDKQYSPVELEQFLNKVVEYKKKFRETLFPLLFANE